MEDISKTEDIQKDILLAKFRMIIDIISGTHLIQNTESPMRLWKDVLNPIKNKLKDQLITLGVDDYVCEHGEKYAIGQICSCRERGLVQETKKHK